MYVLETSQISGDPKPGICLTYVVSLVVLSIPWLRSWRGSLPAQFSGGHKIQNPVLHLCGATGFRGVYGRFLHPLSLSGLPWYGFGPIYQGLFAIPDTAEYSLRGIASGRTRPRVERRQTG